MTQSVYDQLKNNPAGLGQLALRDILLPSILGDEAPGILYWAGKDLARQLPVASNTDIIQLFEQLSLGHLELTKKNGKQQVWQLTGAIVENRLKFGESVSFNLETGLLAQEIEFQTGSVTEAAIEKDKRKAVNINVYYDLDNQVDDQTPVDYIKLSD